MRRDDWGTPPWLFDLLNREYGPFDLDAAAHDKNAKCERFLTDALSPDPWPGRRIWMNPPYGRIAAEFVARAALEAQRAEIVCCLLPCRPDTAWWHDVALVAATEVRFLRGRVGFVPPCESVRPKHGNRPVHSSVVVSFTQAGGPPTIGKSILCPRNNVMRERHRESFP